MQTVLLHMHAYSLLTKNYVCLQLYRSIIRKYLPESQLENTQHPPKCVYSEDNSIVVMQ